MFLSYIGRLEQSSGNFLRAINSSLLYRKTHAMSQAQHSLVPIDVNRVSSITSAQSSVLSFDLNWIRGSQLPCSVLPSLLF